MNERQWLSFFAAQEAALVLRVSLAIERNAAGRFDYIVTTTSGYRAVIEKCDRDDCVSGALPECRRLLNYKHQHEMGGKNSADAWLRHARACCHGWHDGRVVDFAAAVSKSYGSYRPFRLRPSVLPRLPAEKVADMLGITVDEYRAELAKAAA